jgi:endonuclease-3
VLEQFIYAVCREGATRAAADQAFENLRTRFFDWNEVRVSGAEEIAETLEGLTPEPMQRAQRIIDFLQEVFETTFSFDLESLHKKGPKLAAKQLSRYQAANDYAVAWVTQHTLDGHAIPLDNVGVRVLRRLHVLDDGPTNLEAFRASLEHQVSKAKGPLFVELLSVLGQEHCHDDAPACHGCPMKSSCPTGMVAKPPRTHAKKPR